MTAKSERFFAALLLLSALRSPSYSEPGALTREEETQLAEDFRTLSEAWTRQREAMRELEKSLQERESLLQEKESLLTEQSQTMSELRQSLKETCESLRKSRSAELRGSILIGAGCAAAGFCAGALYFHSK